MLTNSRRGVGVLTAFLSEHGHFARSAALLLVAGALGVAHAQMNPPTPQTNKLVRGGQPFGITRAFFDPPCTVSGCPGSSPITTIVVGDTVQWDRDNTLSFEDHSTTEGDCGAPGSPAPPLDCPPIAGDGIHSTDHSGPGHPGGADGGTSTDHRNIDASSDSLPWHFNLPIQGLGVTNHIQFTRAGIYPYFCTPHQNEMRGTVIVNKANIRFTTISGGGGTTSVGQTVTYTVDVVSSLSLSAAAGVGAPTGTVTIMDGSTAVRTGTLIPQGTTGLTSRAVVDVSQLSAGTHNNITAVYNGDNNFNTNTSGTAPQQQVNIASTTTSTPTSTTNPTTFGSPTTFDVLVTSTFTVPTGNVRFEDGGVAIPGGTVPVNGTGHASLIIGSLAVGPHNVRGVFEGNSDFATSTSGTVAQIVNKATPTVTASGTPNPSPVGQPVVLRADLGFVGSMAPTGTVTFKDGGVDISGPRTIASNIATFPTSALSTGDHSIVAEYNPGADPNFNGTSSPPFTQTVIIGTSSVALSSSLNPSAPGASVTFTATVTPSAGTSGTVDFKDGATILASPAVNGSGVALFSTSALAIGKHSITAAYSGNPSFNPSTSVILTQLVPDTQADLTISLNHPNLDPVMFGSTLQFTASVNKLNGGSCGSPPCPAHEPVVTFNFSSPVLVSSATGGTCTPSGATIACSLADIPNAGNAVLTLMVSAPLARSLTVTAVAGSFDVDPNLTNNTSLLNTANIRIRPFSFRLGQLLIFP